MNIALELSEWEVEHLIDWHTDQQYETAGKELYDDAQYHKRRRGELLEIKRRASEQHENGKSDGRD